MLQSVFTVKSNKNIAPLMYKMTLEGDTSAIKSAGQFVNIKLDGFSLRRPISVCDVNGELLTLIYKTVGEGTDYMSNLKQEATLDLLSGLGNGYNIEKCGNSPLLIGGGSGVPPLLLLAKKLKEAGKTATAVLGFASKNDVFCEQELSEYCKTVVIATVDGSRGVKGFVTDALPNGFDYVCACGPMPMLRAVYAKVQVKGQYSLEERMGCGFGACLGCSIVTKNGIKRVCKEGPVFDGEEIIWQTQA